MEQLAIDGMTMILVNRLSVLLARVSYSTTSA